MLDSPRDDSKLLLIQQEWIPLNAVIWLKAIAEVSHGILVAHIVIPVRSKHSESFARASLAIGKYSRIVTLQYIIDIVFMINMSHVKSNLPLTASKT